jgi:hypothetical protein
MSRPRLVGRAVAGAILSGVVIALALFAQDFRPEPMGERVGGAVSDWIWIAAGLIAWHQRPANRVGLRW